MPTNLGTLKAILETKNGDSDFWIRFLNEWRDLLKPLMDVVTLKVLGKTKCLSDGRGNCYELMWNNPSSEYYGKFEKCKKNNLLGIQGIFASFTRKSLLDENVEILWGMSRGGQWLVAEIFFKRKRTPVYEANLSEYMTVENVRVKEVDSVTDILFYSNIFPQEIYLRLKTVFEEWYARSEKTFNVLGGIKDIIGIERQMLTTKGIDFA